MIDPAANVARRQLGPTAWLVLEELILSTTDQAARPVAAASVRAIAVRTGLATGTVARALARLRRDGFATPHQLRRSGTFAAGGYELRLPDGVALHWVNSDPPTPSRSGASARRVDQQLTLAIEP